MTPRTPQEALRRGGTALAAGFYVITVFSLNAELVMRGDIGVLNPIFHPLPVTICLIVLGVSWGLSWALPDYERPRPSQQSSLAPGPQPARRPRRQVTFEIERHRSVQNAQGEVLTEQIRVQFEGRDVDVHSLDTLRGSLGLPRCDDDEADEFVSPGTRTIN